jgi:hypothetical protein
VVLAITLLSMLPTRRPYVSAVRTELVEAVGRCVGWTVGGVRFVPEVIERFFSGNDGPPVNERRLPVSGWATRCA